MTIEVIELKMKAVESEKKKYIIFLYEYHLLRQVHVFNCEKPGTEAWNSTIMNNCSTRRRQDITEVSKGSGSEQHNVRVALMVEKSHKNRNKGVNRKGTQRLLGSNGKHLAKLGQRLHLPSFLAICSQPSQDLLEPPALV